MSPDGPVIFVHPSDEHYGADRILLHLHGALPPREREHAEFWLPNDLPHGMAPLCAALEARGATVRHVELPILRRAYRRPRELVALLRRCVGLWSALRRANPGTVYCTTSAAFLAAPVARLARVPHVVGHVQELWTRTDSWVLRFLARSCQMLLAISGPVKAALPTALHDRTRVVPNATPEPQRVVPLAGRTGPLRYLVASRWNAWKGHGTLLAAWDLLEEPGRLVILGGPPASGPGVDVAALVGNLRHPETVDLVGEVPDIDSYIEEADVVVVPSDQPEPFGLVAVEALARGRPVIGSDDGGLSSVLHDDLTGWLYPREDVAALARVLASLERDRVAEAGIQARREYEKRFTVERYAEAWRGAVCSALP